MSTDVDHGVDRARPAQRLAARLVADAPVQAGLRHCLECPVVGLGRHLDRNADRSLDHPIVARAPSLQEANADFGVFAETARHGTAGGPSADNDVIKLFHVTLPPPGDRYIGFYGKRTIFSRLAKDANGSNRIQASALMRTGSELYPRTKFDGTRSGSPTTSIVRPRLRISSQSIRSCISANLLPTQR